MRPLQMSQAELQKLQGRGVPRLKADQHAKRESGKFGNHAIAVDGQKFDSKAEYRRWGALLVLLRAGEIHDLKRQVPFELVPSQKKPSGGTERAISYVADFVYRGRAGVLVVEDVKGMRTKDYVMKRKLMLWKHRIEIREVQA